MCFLESYLIISYISIISTVKKKIIEIFSYSIFAIFLSSLKKEKEKNDIL